MDKLESYLLKRDFKRKGSLKDFAGSLLTGGTEQDFFKISDRMLERYYQIAERLLQDKRYDEASDAFFFLIYLNPYYHSFWVGLGVAEQGRGNFSDAAFAYLMAQATKKEDPIPYLNIAKCYLALGEKEVACENIDHAINYSSEYDSVNTEAKELKRICAA